MRSAVPVDGLLPLPGAVPLPRRWCAPTGIVRDSVLNKTNDFQIFAESFENVVFSSVLSRWPSSPSSATAAPSLPSLWTARSTMRARPSYRVKRSKLMKQLPSLPAVAAPSQRGDPRDPLRSRSRGPSTVAADPARPPAPWSAARPGGPGPGSFST